MSVTTDFIIGWIILGMIPFVGCLASATTMTAASTMSPTPVYHPEIYLENRLCDAKEPHHIYSEKCKNVVVHRRNSNGSRVLACSLIEAKYRCLDPNNGCSKYQISSRNSGPHLPVQARYVNPTTVVCKLRTIGAYYIGLSTYNHYHYNGSYNPSDPKVLYMAYNSLCQTCNAETATCVSSPQQMRDYCRSKLRCVNLGDRNPERRCQICQKDGNNRTMWITEKTLSCGYAVFPVWSIVLLAIVGVAAIVVIVFLVLACVSK